MLSNYEYTKLAEPFPKYPILDIRMAKNFWYSREELNLKYD